MKREKQAQKMEAQKRDFLKKFPALKQALKVFDISYEQYQKTLQGSYHFYTGISTSHKEVRLRSKSK